MAEFTDKLSFRDDFPRVSTEAWEAKIKKDLKGSNDYTHLTWHTLEGIPVKPFYRWEDIKEINHSGFYPSSFPWVRGKTRQHNGWFVRQDLEVSKDPEITNHKALKLLSRGVDSLRFIIDPDQCFPRQCFHLLLKDICLPAIDLNFSINHGSSDLVDMLFQRISEESLEKKRITGSVDFNPLGCLNRLGKFCGLKDEVFDEAKSLVEKTGELPYFTTLEVDAARLHHAGADIVQELAFAMAMGNEYLAMLTERGLTVDTAAQSIHFRFGVGRRYFLEISKFRAARMLWAKVVEAYQPARLTASQMKIHAETSQWNQTGYDAYNNILRGTTEAMAASIGGADSITVTPFDNPFGTYSEFAERIARNIQLILKEEAYFDHVVDPAGGAYYIESLTQSFADNAWKLFQEVEQFGGYIECFKQGWVQNKIRQAADQRLMHLAVGKEVLVGVNLYPNPHEKMEDKYGNGLIQNAATEEEPTSAGAIKPFRGAEELESIRFETENLHEKIPRVFLLTMGDNKMRRARAQFASGFFAAGGFKIIENNGFDSIEEAVASAHNQQSDIVVICSSDMEYEDLVAKISHTLENNIILAVAGYPKEAIEKLKAWGVRYFIHSRSNLVESLKLIRKDLGIGSIRTKHLNI